MAHAWNIKDLRASIMTPKGVWRTVPLSESPFYLCLAHNKSKKIFDQYYNLLTDPNRTGPKCNPNEATYEEFINLYENIRDNGIRPDFRPRIGAKGIIGDGQHRLSILHYLGVKTINS